MSKPKWAPGKPITWNAFLTMGPWDFIYDAVARRATQAGIVMNMPFILVRNMLNRGCRYFYAVPIEVTNDSPRDRSESTQ